MIVADGYDPDNWSEWLDYRTKRDIKPVLDPNNDVMWTGDGPEGLLTVYPGHGDLAEIKTIEEQRLGITLTERSVAEMLTMFRLSPAITTLQNGALQVDLPQARDYVSSRIALFATDALAKARAVTDVTGTDTYGPLLQQIQAILASLPSQSIEGLNALLADAESGNLYT